MAIGMKRRKRQRSGIPSVRPRLCVFRSLNHIYAQVIDDSGSVTLAAASSRDAELGSATEGKMKTAGLVGSLVGKRAVENGVTKVVFDRRGYKYHGRVKALAEGARGAGLEF